MHILLRGRPDPFSWWLLKRKVRRAGGEISDATSRGVLEVAIPSPDGPPEVLRVLSVAHWWRGFEWFSPRSAMAREALRMLG